jgi:CheY-like chemotaxis protein
MGAAEAAQQARKHIFCVNGAAEFLALLAELFSEERYNVTTTNYVPETFDMITTLQPDLLIVDLVIGVHAGWALLERLTSEAATRGIPVIVTSTDQRILDEMHAHPERYGVHQHLVKPFDIDTILGFVSATIGSADQRIERSQEHQ